MFDPNTLDTLATFTLPPRQSLPTNLFQDFTGGGYFYLDNHDRVVTSTTTHHILVIAETGGGAGFHARPRLRPEPRADEAPRTSPPRCRTRPACCGS